VEVVCLDFVDWHQLESTLYATLFGSVAPPALSAISKHIMLCFLLFIPHYFTEFGLFAAVPSLTMSPHDYC
jgi:hypothetical protein